MSQGLALLLSIGVEAAVAFAMVGALGWGSGPRAALAAALGTIATHWIAWQSMLDLMATLGSAAALLAVEAGVVLAESLAYRLVVPLSPGRALAASLAANAASTGFGLALYALNLA